MSQHHVSHPFCPIRILGLAALVLALCAHPAAADSIDIRKADNAVNVDFGGTYLNYAETSGGTKQDSEIGWMPTVGVGASLLSSDRAVMALRNLYLHIDGRASYGSTAYDGALCDVFGTCTPYQNSTDDQIYTGSVQVGRAFTLSPHIILTPYGEVGYRHWNRDMRGSYGYTEAYGNGSVLGGLMAQVSPNRRWVITLSAAGGSTFDAAMITGGTTFNLTSETIWRVQGKVGYVLTDRLELTGSAQYQRFSYGASPVNAAGYFEPDSTTEQTTLTVGMAYHFF